MDTHTVMGRAMFQLLDVFAKLERGQNHERIVAAKVAGVHEATSVAAYAVQDPYV